MIRFCILFFVVNVQLTFGQSFRNVRELGLNKSQLETSFEKRHIILTNLNTGKKKKIKEGAYAIIKLKGDTVESEVILSAFLNDSIIVANLKPSLDNYEIRLEFDEFRVIPLDQIELINYSVKHQGGTSMGSFLLTLTGIEVVLLPIILPLTDGTEKEVYSNPAFPVLIVSGVAMYYLGKKLKKKLESKNYYVTEWNYRIVK